VRIGNGYDVHALVAGRRLVIGGVSIEWHFGLAGHSDADVLLHSICDACLGAAALGDLGLHFPADESRFQGMDSRVLLREVVLMLESAGWAVVNLDSTIIAEQPKMAPYIPRMRENIAADLKLSVDCVSVKATTTEHLGFAGRGEGIAAQSVVLVEEISSSG